MRQPPQFHEEIVYEPSYPRVPNCLINVAGDGLGGGRAVICCVANSCWAAEKTPLTPKYTILFREIELPYAVGCGSSLVVFDQISDKVRLFDIATRKVCSASIGERVRLHGVAAFSGSGPGFRRHGARARQLSSGSELEDICPRKGNRAAWCCGEDFGAGQRWKTCVF